MMNKAEVITIRSKEGKQAVADCVRYLSFPGFEDIKFALVRLPSGRFSVTELKTGLALSIEDFKGRAVQGALEVLVKKGREEFDRRVAEKLEEWDAMPRKKSI
jgi:hypothetical protein